MDEGLSAAVSRVFVQLYREGLIYRGTRLDQLGSDGADDASPMPNSKSRTRWNALADTLSVRSRRRSEGIEIATTRPETMLADVAVAVHPNDPRYAHLIGRNVAAPPLLERGDSGRRRRGGDTEFGTGAVKVTPAHDPIDYEIGLRHKLADADRHRTRRAHHRRGDRRRALCRARPLRSTRAHRRRLGRASGCCVEAATASSVGVDELAQRRRRRAAALAAVVREDGVAGEARRSTAYREGGLRFVPERFGRTYEHWLENIRDWNISRQVWWGHQLPVWYTPDGARSRRRERGGSARNRAARPTARASSRAIPTRSTRGSPAASGRFRFSAGRDRRRSCAAGIPRKCMITGREIIFLWVARMVMLGLHFMNDVPFRDGTSSRRSSSICRAAR